ncbi:NFACT family protein [Candidatus Woesearchaeota archaeon]|nr:NFACT family protein [Candidatus Woesearchaeota archaeon]
MLLPLEVQKWKDREVKPRMAYLLPKQEHNPLQLQEEELPALHANAGKSLVKTLAVDLGLGGVYAEEFCLVAKLDKEKQTITTEESKRIYSLLQQLVEKKTDARVVLQNNSVLDIVPFPLEIYAAMEQKAFPSFNEALDTCLSQQQNAETKEKAVKGISLQLGKYEKIVEKQSEQVVSLEKRIQENQRKGELLYEHYQSIQGLLQRIQELRKKHPWKEIEKKVKEECPFVQSIQEREGKITIEL